MEERVRPAPAPFDTALLEIVRQGDAATLRQRPGFWDAADVHSRLTLSHLNDHPSARWLFKDMGRSAILTRALLLESETEAVTLADLLQLTGRRNTSSTGRVVQVIRRAEKLGFIQTADAKGPWIRRRLLLLPRLIEHLRARAKNEVTAAAVVAPELHPAVGALDDDRVFRRFLVTLRRFDGMPPDLRGPPTPAIRSFLQHESGMAMLRSLQLAQPRQRAQMLESAPFSRSALARAGMVSRAHVTRVFEAAEEAGWLSLPTPRLVTFSPSLSEEFEWFFAVTFQVIRASAIAAMGGKPSARRPARARHGQRAIVSA